MRGKFPVPISAQERRSSVSRRRRTGKRNILSETAVDVNPSENSESETPPSGGASNSNNAFVAYAVFAGYTIWLYAAAPSKLFAIDQELVPTGDAFTYTVFFYRILDAVRNNFLVCF